MKLLPLAFVAAFALAPLGLASTAAEVDAQLDAVMGTHEGFEEFLEGLKFAASSGDEESLAEMVSYPITVKLDGKDVELEDADQFTVVYEEVMTPAVLKAIAAQTYDTLFVNAEGVMIGNGEIWFNMLMSADGTTSNGIKITAINQP